MKATATKTVRTVDHELEVASAELPTRFGRFRMYGFRYEETEAAALVAGDPRLTDARVSLQLENHQIMNRYLATKRDRMGHLS